MPVFEEVPRSFEDLAHDASDVLNHVNLIGGGPADDPVGRLAWQVERLARQVAEISQRLSGDTETVPTFASPPPLAEPYDDDSD